jgi:hypothetical protein
MQAKNSANAAKQARISRTGFPTIEDHRKVQIFAKGNLPYISIYIFQLIKIFQKV